MIAASAFAVASLEEVDSLNQKKTPAETRQTSLSKGKSRKEDNLAGPPDAKKPTKRISSKRKKINNLKLKFSSSMFFFF